MKEWKKYAGIYLLLVGAVVIVYIRFDNIDMSETRLLVSYWKELLAAVIFVISGLKLYLRYEEEKEKDD